MDAAAHPHRQAHAVVRDVPALGQARLVGSVAAVEQRLVDEAVRHLRGGGVRLGERQEAGRLGVEVNAQRAAPPGRRRDLGRRGHSLRGRRRRMDQLEIGTGRTRPRRPASPSSIDSPRPTRRPPKRRAPAQPQTAMATLARRKSLCYSGSPASCGGGLVHEATADRISPDHSFGIGAARAQRHSASLRPGAGAATDQSRSAAAAELQHPDGAGKVSERRDVDLRPAQAHEPVPGQGRPGARLPADHLRVPRRAAEVQRRSGGQDEEGKEEGDEVGRPAGQGPARTRSGGDEGRLPPLRPAALLPG